MELDVRQLFRLVRRWWWLLLLAPIATGFAARELEARSSAILAPEYSAHATLLINPEQDTGRPNYSVSTYGALLETSAVLEPVITALELPQDVEALRERVSAGSVLDSGNRETDLLQVTVVDADPEQAALIANAVAESFVTYVANRAMELIRPSQAEIDRQLQVTEDQIADTQQQIRLLEGAPDSTDPTSRAQIDDLRNDLDLLQTSYSDLLVSARELDLTSAATQVQVSMADPADVPTAPIPTGGINPAIPASLAGLFLAGGVILLLAYLDTTVKTTADVVSLTGAPLLGAVPRLGRLRSSSAQLFTVEQPQTKAAEAVRLIRTNVLFASSEGKTMSLAITSAGQDEGRTTIAVNLGVTMAQAGLSVVVIDGDLRNPSLHKILDVSNERGLTTLLTQPNRVWSYATVKTMVRNLSLIPSGPLPQNPADLLSLDRLPHLLEEIEESFDVVIIDTPPALTVSDSLAVAAHVDGVILVCQADKTRRHALRAAAAALRQGDVQIIGAVLNGQSQREPADAFYPPAYTNATGGGHSPVANGTMPNGTSYATNGRDVVQFRPRAGRQHQRRHPRRRAATPRSARTSGQSDADDSSNPLAASSPDLRPASDQAKAVR